MLRAMSPLRLDFSGSDSRIRLKSALFAGLAVLMVGAALFQYRMVLTEIHAVESDMEALAGQGIKVSRQPGAEEAEAVVALGKVGARLSVPWQPLLDAIAASVVNQVVLLSFQPNVVRGELTMTGAATKIPAVLEFVERLRAQPSLKEVYLKNHETGMTENGRFPVHFTITLKWKPQS